MWFYKVCLFCPIEPDLSYLAYFVHFQCSLFINFWSFLYDFEIRLHFTVWQKKLERAVKNFKRLINEEMADFSEDNKSGRNGIKKWQLSSHSFDSTAIFQTLVLRMSKSCWQDSCFLKIVGNYVPIALLKLHIKDI